MTESSPVAQQLPNRRLLRFSLRTLLILTALVAVWFAWQVTKAQKQRAAVAAIEAAGGVVTYESVFPDDSRIADFIGRDFTQHVNFVHMKDSRTTDDDLASLADLPRTKMLVATDCNITDDGLRHVQQLRNLAILYISSTCVSDSGLDIVEKVRSLRLIVCVDCPVSADRVAAFRHARPDVELVSTIEEWEAMVR